jgi:hypothetical protein
MQKNELKAFVKQNSPWIYGYINSVILKDIGQINPNYFVTLIKEFFSKDTDVDITAENFGYFLISLVLGEAKKPYTFFRKETITLNELYKEVSVYYNYVRFFIKDDYFCIDLIQTKMGVTQLDEELIKFSKQFPMKNIGFEQFTNENSDKNLDGVLIKIKEDIDSIL